MQIISTIYLLHIYIIDVYQNNKTIIYINIVIVTALIKSEFRLGMTYQNLGFYSNKHSDTFS